VAVRNVRRDVNDQLKKMKNDKDITEDQMHAGQSEVQTITDAFVQKADDLLAEKEKEIMEI
jgi:ribosome recycling factor